jgi:[ribosomal protein S18]-alanine N-acetyltransferase
MSAVLNTALPHLRDMQEADVPAVLAIERAAYEFPWNEGVLRDCFKFGYVCKVYDSSAGIIGYGIISIGAGECHFLNICVAPPHQQHGHGARLVAHLLQVARQARARTALLEVRASNSAAFRLYHRMGFNEIGVRKGYYPARAGREDALVLAREL